MDAIKECIDPKYHRYIKYGGENAHDGSATAAIPSMSLVMPPRQPQSAAVAGVPFPPKVYQRGYASGGQNVAQEVDNVSKWDAKKFRNSPIGFENI